MTRDEVLRLAREAGIPDDNIPSLAWGRLETGAQLLERFAALVAAAERAMMPPAPIIVDASQIDPSILAEAAQSMKRARPVLLASTPRPDEIAAAVAAERIKHQAEIQRLTTLANTAEKWRGIAMARDGDGRTVQQVQEEARAEEREACVQVLKDMAAYGKVFRRIGKIRTPAMNALRLAIDAIRARGSA